MVEDANSSETTNGMFRLEAKSVRFFSQLDEEMFFSWLDTIDAIFDYTGVLASVFMWVDQPSDEDLRNLIAFFERYKIEKGQLAQLLTDENRAWFADEKMVWYREIFGAVEGK